MRRWWRGHGTGPDHPAPPPSIPSILDEYVDTAPSPQNAVDVFGGEWSSRFPPPLAELSAGGIPLFEDDRVGWALGVLGDLTGATVLELGPLEGGHSYLLDRAGATVTAVEAQTRAYLKCLIAKELLGMPRVRFLLGDLTEYLRTGTDRFDVCFASGVLYHMRDPVRTLDLISTAAARLFLWTHVYDPEVVAASPLLAPRFSAHERRTHAGLEHTVHRFNYESALAGKGFCGGSAPHSHWLSRPDLFAALTHFGWQVDEVSFDQPDHPHGPALALVAHQDR